MSTSFASHDLTSPPRPGPTILLVDDDEVKRYTLARILRREGYRLREVATVQETWQAALEEPDLIILDVGLPDGNGLDVGRQLRADPRTATIPLLYVSAQLDDAELRQEAAHIGADGYLPQPLAPVVVSAQVRSLVRLRHAERLLRQELEEKSRRSQILEKLNEFLATPGEVSAALKEVTTTLTEYLGGWALAGIMDGASLRFELGHIDARRRDECLEDLRGGPPDRWAGLARKLEEALTPAELAQEVERTFAQDLEVRRGSALVLPLQGRGGTLGFLAVGRCEADRPLKRDEAEFTTDIARRAALAIEAAYLYEEVQRAREEQQRVLVRYQRLSDSPVVGIFTFCGDGLVSDANDEFLRMIGFGRGALERGEINWRALTPPDSQAQTDLGYLGIRERGFAGPYEKQYLRQDGTRVDVMVAGASFTSGGGDQGIGIAVDITSRKRAEQRAQRFQELSAALSKATTPEEVARAIVEVGLVASRASAGSVAVVEGEELRFLAYFGYTAEVMQPWLRLPLATEIPVCEAARSQQSLFIASREEMVARFPLAGRARVENNAFAVVPMVVDGTTRGVLALSYREARAFPADERGFIEAVAQLSSQALARAQLFDAERLAKEKAHRLAAIQQRVMGIVGHDLRNPLQAILMATRALVRKAPPTAEYLQRTTSRIDASAHRMGGIIDDLMDYTSMELGAGLLLSRTQTDLGRVTADAVDELALGTGKAIQLETRGEVSGNWDARRLAQVVSNLVGNALKHGSPAHPVRVTLEDGNGEAVLTVSNQGEPIPAAFMPYLFDAFARPEGQQREGLGLGLYIVREIVKAHGGTITAVSEADRTDFRVTLPKKAPGQEPRPD